MNKKTLVIGASENPERYSFKAIEALRLHKHEVVALAKKPGRVNGVSIQTNFPKEEVDTVSMYIGAPRQAEYYSKIISLKPKRVIFNPGTENTEFAAMLNERDIEVEVACTLVLLSIGNY